MASLIYNKKTKRWAVQFVAKDGRRPMIRLGKVARKAGELVRMHVDNLVSASLANHAVARETAEWLGEIGDDLHRKLARAGLVRAREARAATTLKAFLDAYIARRTDVKLTTTNNLKQLRNWMVEHFGAGRDIATITRGEIGDWHRFIKARLAQPTVAMHVKKARQVFQDAVDRRLLAENPVKGLKAGTMENRERLQFVPNETVERVIAKCPDAEWKLIFALSRFQGMRVPSETSALRWSDVDWERGRMTVRSPKTEGQGKASRTVPIFPRTLPYLRDVFELAREGAKNVIIAHRGENLRTTAVKILDRAGVEQWPRLFQNLRSSRETELAREFPMHVVCDWIGNTEKVAMKHYLQTTDAHFEQASGKSAAKSAADTAGHDRTNPAPDPGKRASESGNGENQCPRWGPNKGGIPAEIRGVGRKALRKALRRIKTASPSRYRDTIALMRAKGGGR